MVRPAALAFCLLALAGGSALAAAPATPPVDLDGLSPARAGASLCFARDFDAAHMAAHRDQKITTVRLHVEVRPGADARGRLEGVVRLAVTRRGEARPLRLSGAACALDAESGAIDRYRRAAGVLCTMAGANPGAGGDVILIERAEAGVTLSLAPTLFALGPADPAGARRAAVAFGAEDQVLALARAPDQACAEARTIPVSP